MMNALRAIVALVALPALAVAWQPAARQSTAPETRIADRFVPSPPARGAEGPGDTRTGSPDWNEYWREYWEWYDRAARSYRERERQAARRYWWRQQQALEHWHRYGWPVPRYSPLVYGPTALARPRFGVGVGGPVVTFDFWR